MSQLTFKGKKHRQVEKNLKLSFFLIMQLILILLVAAWQCRFVSTTLFLLVETFTPPYHLSARTIRKKSISVLDIVDIVDHKPYLSPARMVDEKSCKIIIKEILHLWIQGFWKLFNKHQTHEKLQRKKYTYSIIK